MLCAELARASFRALHALTCRFRVTARDCSSHTRRVFVICARAVPSRTQHDPKYTQEQLKIDLMEKVMKPLVPAHLIVDKTIYHINASGLFTIGGPEGRRYEDDEDAEDEDAEDEDAEDDEDDRMTR